MYNKTAQKYLDAGLNPVPLDKGEKVPNITGWVSPIKENLSKYNFQEIGIGTGAVSGGLEVIDFDLDVLDNPDEIWKEWKSKVPKSILRKLTISKTKSGGYHAFYRTSVIEGNKKLASKTNKDVIIETRGEGGYVKCFPSEGYEIIYGSLTNIKFIEDYERNVLITTSKLYDERIREKKSFYADGQYEDPFPKYNNNPDIGLDTLEKNGWEILKEDSEWAYLKRPNKRRKGISATYNLKRCFLYVFSTSTNFETEKPYSNSALFCILEHGEDYKKGYRELNRLGFGVDTKDKAKCDSYDTEDDSKDLSFISWAGEDEDRLEQFIDGTIPLGLSFGWPELDEYYVYKDMSLNFLLAFEGVGKTFMMLHKLASLATLYGKKFAICCGENEVSTVKRYLLEALTGKRVSDYKNNRQELQLFKDFLHTHFYIFKNEIFYSVEDILERALRLGGIYRLDGIFIDPFSYFKKPFANAYNYNDDLLSRLNIFAHNEMTVFMSVHPNTEAARAPKDSEGYIKAPSHYDAIGGNMFANRCDGFMVYHRITNHRVPAYKRIMEIRSAKIKDYDTGGSVTPSNESVALSYKTVDGFTGYFDSSGNNPIMNSQRKQEKRVESKPLPKVNPTDAF